MSRDVLVVVPTRGDRPELLRITLRSLLAQTLAPRIVVVTGSGVDAITAEWLSHPTISVQAETAEGLSAAINQAWQHDGWTSEFTAWLGDDDALPPWSLDHAVSVLDAHPRSPAVHGECLVVDADGAPLWVFRNGRLGAAMVRYGHNMLAQPGSLFRTEAVRRVGGLDVDLKLAMDVDLFVRLRALGPIATAPRQLGVFRAHLSGLSTVSYDAAREESELVMRRARRTAAAALLDRLARPLTRTAFAAHTRRGPAADSYWRPAP